MGANIAAFSSKEGLDSVKTATGGEILTWQQLVK